MSAGGGPAPALPDAAALVFVPDPAAPMVTDSDRHHLLDVLRLQPGEPVLAADGAGAWAPCRVAGPGDGRAGPVLVPDGPVHHQPAPTRPVTVGFVPTKGDRPEWVVQKLTEVGVDHVVALRSERSVVRWEGERGARSVARLVRVAREASAQCRRPRWPEVVGVLTLDELAEQTEQAEQPAAAELAGPGLRLCLAHPGGEPPSLGHAAVAVGPEGGWSPGERERFAPGPGFGPTVLRAETAAVVAGALLCGLRDGVVAPLA